MACKNSGASGKSLKPSEGFRLRPRPPYAAWHGGSGRQARGRGAWRQAACRTVLPDELLRGVLWVIYHLRHGSGSRRGFSLSGSVVVCGFVCARGQTQRSTVDRPLSQVRAHSKTRATTRAATCRLRGFRASRGFLPVWPLTSSGAWC